MLMLPFAGWYIVPILISSINAGVIAVIGKCFCWGVCMQGVAALTQIAADSVPAVLQPYLIMLTTIRKALRTHDLRLLYTPKTIHCDKAFGLFELLC